MPKEKIAEPSNTRIDLGEDLLAYTADLHAETSQSKLNLENNQQIKDLNVESFESGNLEDQLQSAKILFNEGFVKDSKALLHRILIKDPRSALAHQLLEQIKASEMKQVLSELENEPSLYPSEGKPEPSLPARPPENSPPEDNRGVEQIVRNLDQDLNLGLFNPTWFFREEEIEKNNFNHNFNINGKNLIFLENFYLKLEKALLETSIQDWIDLGIAFLEMELYPVAIRLFSNVIRKAQFEPGLKENSLLWSATHLLALGLLLSGQPFEAISSMQTLIQNDEIPQANKIELFYLMGSAYEAIQKPSEATQYFLKVQALESNYRNIKWKLNQKKI